MEKFVVKKLNIAEKQYEETSAKKLKKDYDNEVETIETLSVDRVYGLLIYENQACYILHQPTFQLLGVTNLFNHASKSILSIVKENLMFVYLWVLGSINMNGLNILSNVMQ